MFCPVVVVVVAEKHKFYLIEKQDTKLNWTAIVHQPQETRRAKSRQTHLLVSNEL